MHRPTFVWIYLTLALIQAGCATSLPLGPTSSKDNRKSLDTIGVVTGRFTPKVRFQAPEPVKGVGDDASVRTSGRALGAMWKACGQAIVVSAAYIIGPFVVAYGCVVTTPFVAMGAAVYGGYTSGALKANRLARKARKSEVKALRDVIDPALAAVATERPLHARLLAQVPARTHAAVVDVRETGPTSPRKRPRYEDLASAGVDTVLEAMVVRIDVSPENAFVLTARVRLIRLADREELHAGTHTFDIAPRSVAGWTADGGNALRASLVSGYRALAGEIVDELFPTTAAPGTVGTDFMPMIRPG